jgi:AbrB family looped-hinge helix DNA binding protein
MLICMETITQISTRGQITLPADTRKQLGLKPGDTFLVHLEGGGGLSWIRPSFCPLSTTLKNASRSLQNRPR